MSTKFEALDTIILLLFYGVFNRVERTPDEGIRAADEFHHHDLIPPILDCQANSVAHHQQDRQRKQGRQDHDAAAHQFHDHVEAFDPLHVELGEFDLWQGAQFVQLNMGGQLGERGFSQGGLDIRKGHRFLADGKPAP